MEEYIGKICPFCKMEIKEGDAVKVCPSCDIPHHEACWEENKGCTTSGCSEQHNEEQHTDPTNVCAKCGAPLEDGQDFCPKCGALVSDKPTELNLEQYIGKICPFCKTEIKKGDAVKVCPSCDIPHHEACWVENKGCTTFGCSEQHYEEQHTNPTDVCVKCGAPLGDGQAFCPKCGTPKGGVPEVEKKPTVCSKCGAELQEGQAFCPKCGQKADLQIDSGVNSAINQFNANMDQTNNRKKKKLPIIIGAVAGVVVLVVVLVLIISGSNKPDFNKMFSDISNESWCNIASDGTWMKIDTNPYDLDDDVNTTAFYKLKAINEELGFSSAVFEEMGETRSVDGRQSATCDKYEVSWTYHPDRGLEAMYKVKG